MLLLTHYQCHGDRPCGIKYSVWRSVIRPLLHLSFIIMTTVFIWLCISEVWFQFTLGSWIDTAEVAYGYEQNQYGQMQSIVGFVVSYLSPRRMRMRRGEGWCYSSRRRSSCGGRTSPLHSSAPSHTRASGRSNTHRCPQCSEGTPSSRNPGRKEDCPIWWDKEQN